MKANIPPFYIGQKVVCIDSTGVCNIIKGQYYTVIGLKKECACGVGVSVSNIPRTDKFTREVIFKGEISTCGICGQSSISDGLSYYFPKRFAPLQEQSYPLMTFSKIIEKEKEEILINN